MQRHIRILGILYIVFGALGVLTGVLALLFFGGLAGFVGMLEQNSDALAAVPILGLIGAVIFVLSILLALPGLIAGLGLLRLKSWARILAIVLSIFNLLQFPFGTALGAYGIWILFSPEATAMFNNPHRLQTV